MINELPTIKKRIKVLIVEDHELTRIGLIHSLQKSDLIEVIGEAEDGQEAISKTQLLNPDVILMDLGLPVIDGIQATQIIKETFPNIKVVMLTSHKKQDEVLASLTAGASAYCLKDIKAERLIQALELVMDGVLWIDPAIAGIILNIVSTSKPVRDKQTDEEEQIKELSPRELEVLRYLAKGHSNKEISEALNISIFTVKRHVGNVIEKLAVDGRTQAAIKALKIGLMKH